MSIGNQKNAQGESWPVIGPDERLFHPYVNIYHKTIKELKSAFYKKIICSSNSAALDIADVYEHRGYSTQIFFLCAHCGVNHFEPDNGFDNYCSEVCKITARSE